MAIRTTPIFVQAGTHPAEETRLMLGGMLGMPPTTFAGGVAASNPAHGIVSATDFAVTQNPTPNMTVLVGVGGAFIRGTENLNQGAYHVWNDAPQSVTINTAHPTLSRRDLIVVSVTDQAYSGGTSDASISVVTGTPGTGTDPTPPANALVLARVTVAALDTAINTADITNLRNHANQRGKIPTFNTSALATAAIPSPVDGQAYYLNLNTDQEGPYFFNGSNYRRPWNMPWGQVAAAYLTTPTSSAGSPVTVIGSNINFSVVARRRYKYTVFGHQFFQSVNDGLKVAITDGVGTEFSQTNLLPVGAPNVNFAHGFSFTSFQDVAVSAAITRQLRVSRFTGISGNVTFFADGTRPGMFLIEDIGPIGAPA
jgi:hypothetical protein